MSRYYAPYSKWLVKTSDFLINNITFSTIFPEKNKADTITFPKEENIKLIFEDLMFNVHRHTTDMSLPAAWIDNTAIRVSEYVNQSTKFQKEIEYIFQDYLISQIKFAAVAGTLLYEQPILLFSEFISTEIKIEGPTWDKNSRQDRINVK